MPLKTNDPYLHDVFTVKQLGKHTVKIAYSSSVRDKGWEDDRKHSDKGTVNTEKLMNNLSRAKQTVKEYALCNPWDWWCTFTLDPKKYDRYNLDTWQKDFSKFLNNYNRCPEEYRVKYLLVPEQHKDGAWHMHGFIKGIRPQDLYINKNDYLTWKQYEKKFGYISMDKVKDQDRASSYILKYMTKDTDKNVTELNRHMYYCSKGLERATELYRGKADYFGVWDWEHPDGYVKIKTLDTRTDNISDYMEIPYDDTTDI
ncbi:MAG: hypothetical protein IJX66_07095 [Lachnospiraceae bacterium]|nr:hypothetical protein [Lachnospiraceae bacterium]